MSNETTGYYTLHAGMTADDAAEAVLPTDSENSPWMTDGDGWNTWGEAPGTESNDPYTLHMQAHVETLEEADELVQAWRKRLAPMSPPVREEDLGVIAVVSDPHVWSEGQDKHWTV